MSDYTIYLIDDEFNRVDGCPDMYGCFHPDDNTWLYIYGVNKMFPIKKIWKSTAVLRMFKAALQTILLST